MAERECPYCGKLVYDKLVQCSYCRETLPESPFSARGSTGAKMRRAASAGNGDRNVHKGLLYMLLAGVIGYFSSGSSGWELPVTVPHVITSYLSLLLFLSGLGLTVYGFYLRHRALGGELR
ncbi:MAG TPA: hypothetical protein VN661_00585 [Candidatus Acidoferrales bacterium]|nr:hypothetical protein [Candidatus Acidoferrales bacterium]